MTNNIAIYFTPLILLLLINTVKHFKAKEFQGLYILAAGLLFGINYVSNDPYPIFSLLLCLIIGEMVHFIIVVFKGSKLSITNHCNILASVGLFPWYLGYKASIAYVILSLFCTLLYAQYRFVRSKKKFDVNKSKNFKEASKYMNGQVLEDFTKANNVLFSIPIIIALIIIIPFVMM